MSFFPVQFRTTTSSRVFAFIVSCVIAAPLAAAQGAKQTTPPSPVADSDSDHVKERNEWFFRGRLAAGKPTAELRRRAYQAKLQLRAQRAAALAAASQPKPQGASLIWTPLGPVPLASDASGNGTQDYHQVAGRATAVAIDPADPTGNTIYVGGAQAGMWKSTNAVSPNAASVAWTPITDDQATLSIGAIAIQPGNSNPAQSVILAATAKPTTPPTLTSASASSARQMQELLGPSPPRPTAAHFPSAAWVELESHLTARPAKQIQSSPRWPRPPKV